MTRTTGPGGPMIETHDLRRTFKTRGSGGRSGPRRGPDGRGRGDLRLPRPQRRRQDDDPADAGHAAQADRRRRHGRRRRPRPRAAGGPPPDRLRAAGRLDRSGRDRPRRARDPGPAVRPGQGDGPAPRATEVLDGARADGGRRPADRHLFGRHAPPARRRARHRPPPARPVPRRADDRAGPAGPRPHVGRDPPPARARAPRSS